MVERKRYTFGVLGRTYGAFAQVAETVPYWLIALAARLGVGMVFWKSGQTKITSDFEISNSAYLLFQNEYFPNLDDRLVDVLTVLGTVTENVCSMLLMLGVLARLNALALLGVTAMIGIFVYPQAWDVHILWTAALLLIVARWPGAISVDQVAGRLFGNVPGGQVS